MHDITSFMTWWLNTIVQMFTWVYTTLDSIRFMGTSLFKLTLGILIISALLKIMVVVPNGLIPKEDTLKLTKAERKTIATNRAYRKGKLGK